MIEDWFVLDIEGKGKYLKIKLPRKSIQLPSYTGGTTSPDFVYAIQGEDNHNYRSWRVFIADVGDVLLPILASKG